MPWETYTSAILPIAGLFAIVLWLGNAAYEYLSVSFIQMLKALMPVSVYTVAMSFGLEKFNQNVRPHPTVNRRCLSLCMLSMAESAISFLFISHFQTFLAATNFKIVHPTLRIST